MVRLIFGLLIQSGVKVTILIPAQGLVTRTHTDLLSGLNGFVLPCIAGTCPTTSKHEGQSKFEGLVVRELKRFKIAFTLNGKRKIRVNVFLKKMST